MMTPLWRSLLLAAGAALAFGFFAGTKPADAIPIFAQRYLLKCEACHSVLPELNAFGNAFRDAGYRLPPSADRHGTTVVALRYQLEYEKDPAAGNRRWTPGGVLLSNADIGDVSYFLHYNLGAGGGPSALFLGYFALANEHTRSLFRAGQYELPLPHSPSQRLDDLQPYGYEATHVGLNDLPLTSPRIGLQGQRDIGDGRLAMTVAVQDFKGAAYGGKPLDTGEFTRPSVPELGIFYTQKIARGLAAGVEELDGVQSITQTGKSYSFGDRYRRTGVWAGYESTHVDLLAQQWWGSDSNADGLGNALGSSGGFVRFRYWPLRWHHAFVGVRYDAAANPIATRDWVFYTGFQATRHARIVLQRVQQTNGSPGHFGGALTFGFPWPLGY